MAATLVRNIECPMHAGSTSHLTCGGEMVEAKTSHNATRWNVAPCASLAAQGWTGPQLVLRFTEIDRYLPTQTVVRHHEGLVWMAS